eukprot:TRINITY_DN2654_c0_g1_i2.p1 TRINITY_DN2654_c0_g1~~TRINITY_DN2654_c0_g1_i2.p1  ORF type:complete len:312 (-),score=70.12 TRINITY_DN2654_c0_g1_i2:76-918(-)
MTFAVHYSLAGESMRISLPVTNPERQMQLLRYISDACSRFHQELTPDEGALVDLMERGIENIARLRQLVHASSLRDESPLPRAASSTSEVPLLTQSMMDEIIQQRAENHEAQGSLGPIFEEPERSEEEEPLPPKRSVAMRPCDYEDLLPLPPKRQVAMDARDFEAIKNDPEIRNLLDSVRLADDQDEENVAGNQDEDEVGSEVEELEEQRQQQPAAQNQVQQGQGALSAKPKDSGKPRSVSRLAKMPSQMWSVLRMVRSSDSSRSTSFKKVCPEPEPSEP